MKGICEMAKMSPVWKELICKNKLQKLAIIFQEPEPQPSNATGFCIRVQQILRQLHFATAITVGILLSSNTGKAKHE